MGKRPVSTLWQPRSRPASQISNTGLAPWLNRLCSDDIMTGQILQCINDMYNGAGLIMQSQGPTPIFLASSTSASECRGRFRWLGGEVASRGGREARGVDQWSTRHSRANPTQGISLIFIGPESDHWECLSLTQSLLFSKLDWCDPGVLRCQLKTCWGCYCCWCWCWGSCWQQFVTDLGADVWS